jgi:hypothetical protein
MDAGSAVVIARELASAFSEMEGENPGFKAEVAQYAQYSEFINQWREGEDGKLAAIWWQTHDGSSVLPLTLPFPQTTASELELDAVSILLPEDILARLDGLAWQEQLSIEALLLSFWAMILMGIADLRDGAVCIETSGGTCRGLSVAYCRSRSRLTRRILSSIFGDQPMTRSRKRGRNSRVRGSESTSNLVQWCGASATDHSKSVREDRSSDICLHGFSRRYQNQKTARGFAQEVDFESLAKLRQPPR